MKSFWIWSISGALFFSGLGGASVIFADTEEESPEPQTVNGVELPVWEPEHPEGHFDTQLWPEPTVEEVEIEHLKFLASSPDVDPQDRKMYLKVVRDWEAGHLADAGTNITRESHKERFNDVPVHVR